MRLEKFEIKDYRSVQKAKFNTHHGVTVLIGPNNAGKSNILQALHCCLSVLNHGTISVSKEIRLRPDDSSIYRWITDYPIAKQNEEKQGASIFTLSFKLSKEEQKDFQKATGSKLNGELPIELQFKSTGYATFKVKKKGRGGPALSKKAQPICEFLAETLNFVYVPSIRTADASLDIINDLIALEFQKLDQNPHFSGLMNELEKSKQQLLDDIAANTKEYLKRFIGSSLIDVQLKMPRRQLYRMYGRASQIMINDGTNTSLRRKGDGVQSLVAIGLMTRLYANNDGSKNVIILLEEPESHLHPAAVHELSHALRSLQNDNQIILTSHSPLLANRTNVDANIIVEKNNATPAKSISYLRSALGVKISDNLQHASIIVVVEGMSDEIIYRSILVSRSEKIRRSIESGGLAIYAARSASKISTELSLLQNTLSNMFVIVDGDSDGRLAIEKSKGFLSQSNYIFTARIGLNDSELEDMLDFKIYKEHFQIKYAVDISSVSFKSKKKWSDRISGGMKILGKEWSESDKKADKMAIANIVEKSPLNSTQEICAEWFENLINRLEALIDGSKPA